MTMRRLRAIKPHKYGTRHLTAGDEYDVPVKYAFALVASKKATFADKPTQRLVTKVATSARNIELAAEEPPEPPPQPHAIGAMTSAQLQPPDINALRLEATALGVNVDGRWGVHRLQEEIEQARRR